MTASAEHRKKDRIIYQLSQDKENLRQYIGRLQSRLNILNACIALKYPRRFKIKKVA